MEIPGYASLHVKKVHGEVHGENATETVDKQRGSI